MIVVQRQETDRGIYHYAEIDVWVGRGSFVVSASRYVSGDQQLALTMRGPRGGYWSAVALGPEQAKNTMAVLRAGRSAVVRGPWGSLVVEPIVAASSVWDGLCVVGYESLRGNRKTHLVSRACRNDLAAAVRFVTEEAWEE